MDASQKALSEAYRIPFNTVTREQIWLTRLYDQEMWTSIHVETGVASQGTTRVEALENLDEAVALHQGEGREVTDEDLEEWGIDPESVPEETQVPDAPWFDE